MKIERADVSPFRLPLRTPLQTACGALAERRGFVLRLLDEHGACGVGEASPAHWVGAASIDSVSRSLAEIAAFAAAGASEEALRRRFLDEAPEPKVCRAAAAALDTALLDLAARSDAIPIARRFSAAPASALALSALLSADTEKGLGRAAEEAARCGFATLKLKVGAGSIDADLRRLRALRLGAGPRTAIRLDANRAWTIADARQFLAAAAPFEPAFVEEPLRDGSAEDLAGLRRTTGARLAIDESLADVSALEAHAEARGAEVAVLKVARLGGITAAVQVGRRAIELGFTVVVTDSIESSIGMAAALHLAASLSLAPEAVGLGGCQQLGGDVVREDDRIARRPVLALPGPGLGVRFDRERARG